MNKIYNQLLYILIEKNAEKAKIKATENVANSGIITSIDWVNLIEGLKVSNFKMAMNLHALYKLNLITEKNLLENMPVSRLLLKNVFLENYKINSNIDQALPEIITKIKANQANNYEFLELLIEDSALSFIGTKISDNCINELFENLYTIHKEYAILTATDDVHGLYDKSNKWILEKLNFINQNYYGHQRSWDRYLDQLIIAHESIKKEQKINIELLDLLKELKTKLQKDKILKKAIIQAHVCISAQYLEDCTENNKKIKLQNYKSYRLNLIKMEAIIHNTKWIKNNLNGVRTERISVV